LIGGCVIMIETTTGINSILQQSDTSDTCEYGGQLCDQLYDLTGNESFAEVATLLVGIPAKIFLIIAGALVVNHLGRRWSVRLVKRLGRETQEHDALVSDRSSDRAMERADTVGSLLRSTVSVVVFGLAVVLILEMFGIDAAAAVASAGVIAIAIGFGAQSVVADLFAGMFMLAEDQFGLGDRVDAGPVNGYVERITLRTTVIRDSNGKLWHVPNSQIDYVANETQSWARAVVIIGVSYSANLRTASDVLETAVRELADSDKWSEHVREAPVVQSVQELGADSVDLRILMHVAPDQRRAIERAIRLQCKEALDTAGIEIPNPQFDVNLKEVEDTNAPAA
jgi:small-conductance mechanosensitive channel